MDEERDRRTNREVADMPERPRDDDRHMEERVPENRTTANTQDEGLVSLFETDTAQQFRDRWLAIQSRFVDDPGDSVHQADDLVADVIENITRSFADRRGSLEQQWNSGNTSTEDLRIALKQYRSFFERLLSLQS